MPSITFNPLLISFLSKQYGCEKEHVRSFLESYPDRYEIFASPPEEVKAFGDEPKLVSQHKYVLHIKGLMAHERYMGIQGITFLPRLEWYYKAIA